MTDDERAFLEAKRDGRIPAETGFRDWQVRRTFDMQVHEFDPDAMVMQAINDYVRGKGTREDIEAALTLAAEFPAEAWREGIGFRREAALAWLRDPVLFDQMLDRALSTHVLATQGASMEPRRPQ